MPVSGVTVITSPFTSVTGTPFSSVTTTGSILSLLDTKTTATIIAIKRTAIIGIIIFKFFEVILFFTGDTVFFCFFSFLTGATTGAAFSFGFSSALTGSSFISSVASTTAGTSGTADAGNSP